MPVNSNQLEAALSAGGVTLGPAVSTSGTPPKYNPMSDPAGVEVLCGALSDLVRPWNPTVVMIWDDSDDIALAHVMGRELHVPWVRVFDADGLVDHVGGLTANDRVVLLSDAFRDQRRLRAMLSLIARAGAAPVGAAAFVETDLQRSLHDDLPRVASLVAYPSRAVDDPTP